MSLVHNNAPFLVLNFNLKSGLLTGALVVSLATGAITLVNHKDEIKTKVEESFQPVQQFLNQHFQTLQSGAIAIAGQGKEWAELVQEKITTHLDSFISQSKWLSGAQAIQQEWKNWFDAYKNKPLEIWAWIKGLDKDKLIKYAQTIHTFVKTIYETLEHISELFKNLRQMLESVKANEVNAHSNLLESILQIAQSQDSAKTIQNLGKTIIDNSNVAFQLGIDNFAAIVSMAASDATGFNEKIKQLSETATTSSGSSEKWGHYTNTEAMMNALGLKNVAAKKALVEKILKVTTCPKDARCGSDYNKIINDFFDSVKKQMGALKSKEDLKNKIEELEKNLTLEKYFEEGQENDTKKLINGLLENSSKQVT